MQPIAIAYGKETNGEMFFKLWSEEKGIENIPSWVIELKPELKIKNIGLKKDKQYSLNVKQVDFLYGINYPFIDVKNQKIDKEYMFTCLGYCKNCIDLVIVLIDCHGNLIPTSEIDLIELTKYQMITNAFYGRDGKFRLRKGKLEAVSEELETDLSNLDYEKTRNIIDNALRIRKITQFYYAVGNPNFGRLDVTYDEYQELLQITGKYK